MQNQIIEKFLEKNLHRNFEKLDKEFYIKFFIKPIIKFNNVVFNINKTILSNFNDSIYITYEDIKIENFNVQFIYLRLSMPFLMQNLYLKFYTKIEIFLIEIWMNSKNFYLKIYFKIYDIKIHNFRNINKIIKLNLEKNHESIYYKVYKNKKKFNLEFWENSLLNDEFNFEIWFNLELKKN